MFSFCKKIIFISIFFVYGTAFSCSPPAIVPTQWDLYNESDIVFVGQIQSSKDKEDFIETKIIAEIYAKNPYDIKLRNKEVSVFSKKGSSLCGYEEPFGVADGIILMGSINESREIWINNLSGSLIFDSLALAIDYYDKNFLQDSCLGSYTAYQYDKNSDSCFELNVKGCSPAYSDTLFETKKQCEDTFVTGDIPNTCSTDVLRCQDGTVLERVPPSCSFPECPKYTPPVEVDPEDVWDGKILCTRDLKRCPDGTYVSRVEPTCEFRSCPIYSEPDTCNADKKRCPDGTFVERSGPFCEFKQCGSGDLENSQRCDTLWNGFKFDEDKKVCIETNIKGCENTLYKNINDCVLDNDIDEKQIKDDFTNCSLEYKPVCGKIDGVYTTYTNTCLMKLEGAEFVGDGSCRQVNSLLRKIIKWFKAFF